MKANKFRPAQALYALLLTLATAQAQYVVTSAADSGPGSLRTVVSNAPAGSAITFDAALDGQTITLTNGQVTISVNLEINATALTNGIIIDGNYPNRIFNCIAGTTNTLSGLTLRKGTSTYGGAIRNEGHLTLNQCTLTANSPALGGGALLNTGTLILNQCTLHHNDGNMLGQVSGLLNEGTATLNNCTVTDHAYEAVRNTSNAVLNLNNCILAANSTNLRNLGTLNEGGINYLTNSDSELDNLAYYGGSTPTRPPLAGSPFIDPVGGDLTSPFTTDQQGNPRVVGRLDIGAVEFQGAVVTTSVDEDNGNMKPSQGNGTSLREALKYSGNSNIITLDHALAGQTFDMVLGRVEIASSITLDPSTIGSVHIKGSSTHGLIQCAAGTTNMFTGLTLSGGSATNGGAILNAGHLTLNQCTLTGNTATNGGAVYNTPGASLQLNSSTIFGNSADDGGGIYNDGSLEMDHSIVAGNTANTNENIHGTSTRLSGVSLISGDPGLSPLDDYDGNAPTCPPAAGSPAIDPAGSSTNSLFSTDQRGLIRIVNGVLDLGAVESQPTLITTTAVDYSEGSLRQTYRRAGFGSTLTLADHLSGSVIALTNGPIPLYRSITLDGTSLDEPIIFDGLHSNRLFDCTSSLPVSLIGLTLRNGYTPDFGGAILNDGFLILEQCTLTNNNSDSRGGAIANGGTLSISNSILQDNSALYLGGALYMESPSSNLVYDTVFSGNTARQGGAVYAGFSSAGDSSNLFERCLFKGNRAEVFAGSQLAKGGAICVNGGGPAEGVILNQCTLTENESTHYGSAVFIDLLSLMTLNHCTVSGNPLGGRPAIDPYAGYLNLHNTIVAGNTPLTGTQIGSSLLEYNETGVNITSGDPQLAPLGDYGGTISTFMPLPGSPAIDPAGGSASSAFSFDQRGEPRSIGGIIDAGAVEFQGLEDLQRDSDGDGSPFGVEYALGTDWLVPDAANSANFAGFTTNGYFGTAFGFNPDATNSMAWILSRSTNLTSGIFQEIYRFEGPTGTIVTNAPVSVTMSANSFKVTDLTSPQPTNAFYRFEAVLTP